MTWLYKQRGLEYHWIVDLYSRMGLPVLKAIQEIVSLPNHVNLSLNDGNVCCLVGVWKVAFRYRKVSIKT